MTIRGGSSLVTYLQKVRDGVIFSETFENDNFLTAQGWTTLQGTPANTSDQYKQGIKSFKNDTGDLPVIKKVVNATQFSSKWIYSVWFYDDATNTTDEGPYIKIKNSSNEWFQVGVRNGVSTGFYSCNDTGNTTEDNFAATSKARSTGWHRLDIQYNATLTSIKIDNTLVKFIANGFGRYPTEIYLNATTVGGSGDSFGYFDSLGLFKSVDVVVNGITGRTIKAFNSQNTEISTLIFDALETFPYSTYYEISSSSDSTVMDHRSVLLQVNPGDIYQYNQIDFGRKFSSMQIVPNTMQDQSMTKAGVRAVETYGLKNRHNFTIDQEQGLEWKQSAENFFYYARRGGAFGVIVDDINDRAFGVIANYIPNTNTHISIMDNLSTLATDKFEEGQYLVVQDKANTNKQVVTVASVDTNSTLTLNERLLFDVNTGDYIYSQFRFPWQEFPPDNLGGFDLVNPRMVRYSWNLPTADFNGDI